MVWMVFISPDVRCQPGGSDQLFGEGIAAKRFYASAVDNDNVVWFLTEAGIVSFNGRDWLLHDQTPGFSGIDLKDVDYGGSEDRHELWFAGPDGATVIVTPFNSASEVITYSPDNSRLNGRNVLAVAVSNMGMRWFGTDKGISAFEGRNWLINNYTDIYPDDFFQYYPLTTMATTKSGDTLYAGTLGGGVTRFYKNEVDAVSGASEYAVWGPILIPSDTVNSLYIARDGTQWIGTNKGVARHTGKNTLEGWAIFDSKAGLADDNVQAINSDTKGNLYFGTKNGLSVFDGINLTTYRIENGLASNNILTIAVDKNNIVWLGTDNGVTCIKNGEFIRYR